MALYTHSAGPGQENMGPHPQKLHKLPRFVYFTKAIQMCEKIQSPGRAGFIEAPHPVIYDWFSRLPLSADRFVFDRSDSDQLAGDLWDSLVQDILGTSPTISRDRS